MRKNNVKHTVVLAVVILLALGLAAYAIFGGRTRRDIIGAWTTTAGGVKQGFHCGTSGIAASIRIDTLQYDSWTLHGKTLILKGTLFSKRKVTDIADTLHIKKINSKELVIEKDGRTIKYHKTL